MKKPSVNAFNHIPRTAKGHFILNLYAAVYWIISYLNRLNETRGIKIEETFGKYPFLSGYFSEMIEYMPDKITWDEALQWWEMEIAGWEKAGKEDFPLLALSGEGVTFLSRIALMIIGLIEEDSRFGSLFIELQEPRSHRRPSIQLATRIILNEGLKEGVDLRAICRPLLSTGLVEVINQDDPRPEWIPRVPSVLWDAIRGEVEFQPGSCFQYFPSVQFDQINRLIFPEDFLERLAEVPVLIKSKEIKSVILRGSSGSMRIETMGSVVKAAGKNIIVFDKTIDTGEKSRHLLGPLCTMTNSLPVIVCDLGPGENRKIPVLSGYSGSVGIIMGPEGGLKGQVVVKNVTLNLPLPGIDLRRRHWQDALKGHTVDNISEISERYIIPGGYIRRAAAMAAGNASLDRRKNINIHDVKAATRLLNRQVMDTLATRLEVSGSWDMLVVCETTSSKLRELEQRCRYRERLLDYLGPAFASGSNQGVRCLISGPSGTGKTYSAMLLASVLEMDIYRLDLAAVINKYIGETEKNLHRVLSRAEELDVILLLDEGDALLGNRTAVKSANDRYANLETNYLLQKLENYRGIVLITSNAADNIDTAFQRRMDVTVNFFPPDAEERLHIWQLHLPEGHRVDQDYLEEASVRCALTGGQIRNAALHVSLLALEEGSGAVSKRHVMKSIKSEYRKAGAICPLHENGSMGNQHGGVEAFLDAFSS